MEESFSDEFKRFFLIKFTEELINHSAKKDILNLQRIIELKERKKIGKKILKQRLDLKERIKPKRIEISKYPSVKTKQIKQITRQSLFIPEPKLPSHLEYLKPIPTTNVEIDLLKINPLLKDSAVRVIEGNPDEKVKVTGTMGTKQTNIILSKEDIDRIIDKFSESSKIPKTEGIYKVVVGNLILSAIISEVVGSRFIIKKMMYTPNKMFPMPSNYKG